jgi:hypothetical protein
VRGKSKYFLKRRETFVDTFGIGRQAEVLQNNRGFVPAQLGNRTVAVPGGRNIEAVETPLELAQQARVIFDNQEFSTFFTHSNSPAYISLPT